MDTNKVRVCVGCWRSLAMSSEKGEKNNTQSRSTAKIFNHCCLPARGWAVRVCDRVSRDGSGEVKKPEESAFVKV